ncbi:MAG: DUF6502 family protein [Pseudomonadota bacterium]
MNLHKDLTTQEVNALAAGVEDVLRQLIRPLLGSMSLERMEELLRLVFLEEAERHAHLEKPERAVQVGQLALLTGTDSRRLNKLRGQLSGGERSHFTSKMTPTTQLLDLWSTDPAYVDEQTDQPRALPVTGDAPSLEALMKTSKFIRGVTPRSVADRLVLSGNATEDEAGHLHMVTEKFMPNVTGDVVGAIEVGFIAVERLVETVLTNLESLDTDGPKLYQRAFWTNRLAPHRREEFQDRLTALMEEFEEHGNEVLRELEMNIESPSQVTGGYGLYYFEDRPEEDG